MDPTQLQALLAELGLTMEDLDAISQAGTYDESAGVLGQQMQQANALRGTPMPEGRRAGGTFVASNPLEMIGAVGMRMKGGRDARGVEEQQRALIEQLRGGLKSGAMLGARERMGAPQAPTPPGPWAGRFGG
jgi:hypothetical protein